MKVKARRQATTTTTTTTRMTARLVAEARFGAAGAWVAMLAVAAVAGCATVGGGGDGSSGALDGSAAGVGEIAPDLGLQGFWDRKPMKLSGLRGKVVLLDVWASWCAPCKDELPALDALAKRLRAQGAAAEIVAVSIDEDRAAAETFLRTRKSWALTFAHDPAGTVPERLQPPKMPTSYLIDKKGVLRAVNAGYVAGDVEKMEAAIRRLL